MRQILSDIKTTANFPSPPAIAQQIIALAGDPDVDVARLAMAISKDPALAAKVLRVANSPLYSQRRKSDNLRQALVVLGLNCATTLALSFSLLTSYGKAKGSGLDYEHYWRRAILGAMAAKCFGTLAGHRSVDTLFLAGLLQDLGVLAIDRVRPRFYEDLPSGAGQRELLDYEQARLGSDHATLGAALLRHWTLPDVLCRCVEYSHQPEAADVTSPEGVGARCVALGNECVEVLLTYEATAQIERLARRGQALLGLDPQVVTDALSRLMAEIPEVERLFETNLLPAAIAGNIQDQAREMLMVRNLQAYQQVSDLRQATENLQARTHALEEKRRYDALTGVFNRGYLDEVLVREFQAAAAGGWALTVVFADLDRFKRVNDTYGHAAGDAVLAITARMLQSMVRETDCVGRYGGEEFLMVLPGLNADGAAGLCGRLMNRLRGTTHSIAGTEVSVTVSLGLATHTAAQPFASFAQLVEAADRCVYLAKRAGRDQLVLYDPVRMAQAG
jgi:diguanylate cyclase (GGDEF)-like protein